MTGKDLVNYIKKYHLEDAEIDTGISDPLQFIVTIPADKVSDERENLYTTSRGTSCMRSILQLRK